jgi:fatty acid desaturase
MLQFIESQPIKIEPNKVTGLVIAVILILLWTSFLCLFLSWEISWLHLGQIIIAICCQTFLYTGLFITAHEAMHGLVYPPNPKINHLIGSIAVLLYAFFPYQKLLNKHWLHHLYPASFLDPDFHHGINTSFWGWYYHFLKVYWNWRRLGIFLSIISLITYIIPINLLNLLVFALLPSLLSSLQLFYFGTFLPHRQPPRGYQLPHNAQSIALPAFWSFITCYHFGYHQEHHQYPQTPWWQLPQIYQDKKHNNTVSLATKYAKFMLNDDKVMLQTLGSKPMPFTLDAARNIFPNTLAADAVPATIARFVQLSAEDQLALIWFAYLEMGKTITVAAPGAASMEFAKNTLNEIRSMSPQQQSQVMCDLANRSDTPICRTYAAWSPNIKLGFWYQLGQWMEDGSVAPIPQGYQLSANATAVLETIKKLESGQQITVLRNAVVDMGFDVSKIGGSYTRISEPVEPPKNMDARTQVKIEGVDNPTVLSYMNNLNANDFQSLIALFAEDGALQPPFQRPIVGKEAVLRFFQEECQNLKLLPERGVSEQVEDGYTQIKVTGKVQTPWFTGKVGMNIAWRFLLNPDNKIFFVAIDLLASPKELLNLVR